MDNKYIENLIYQLENDTVCQTPSMNESVEKAVKILYILKSLNNFDLYKSYGSTSEWAESAGYRYVSDMIERLCESKIFMAYGEWCKSDD